MLHVKISLEILMKISAESDVSKAQVFLVKAFWLISEKETDQYFQYWLK